MRKKILCIICLILFIPGFTFVGFTFVAFAGMGSENYRISTSVLSGGGAAMGSTNFQMTSTLGQPSPLMGPEGPLSSQNLSLLPGFWYTIDISLDIFFEMNLSSGWHMISLPVIPNDTTVSSLFPKAKVIYGYKRKIGYMEIKNNEELGVRDGYWILLDQNQNYPLTGQSVQSCSKILYEDGWDMIGGCASSAKASADGCNIGAIYGYVPGIGYQRVLETENLEPDKGYWILLNDVVDKCVLTVKSTGSDL